jgi:hypothetical protein
LALEYDEDKNSVDDKLEDILINDVFVKRYRVSVNIHFWDDAVANVFSLTLKDGSYQESERKWCSFLHFQNKQSAKMFLDIKFNETMSIWSLARK